MCNSAGAYVAFLTVAAQSLTEAAVTGHVSGIDPGIVVLLPPLGRYALLGDPVICLSGQVTLALGAVEAADSDYLHVIYLPLRSWSFDREVQLLRDIRETRAD